MIFVRWRKHLADNKNLVLSQIWILLPRRRVLRYLGPKAMAGGMVQIAIDFKDVHYPKPVILHAVFFYAAMPSPIATWKKLWPSAGSKLTMQR